MLQGLFNYDNPVWRFLGKLGDLMILHFLWVVCSIPIFTIGASTTAVYYVTMKLVRDESNGTVREFFHSFKENFKQATALWLILLAVGLLLVFDLWFVISNPMGLPRGIRNGAMVVFTAMTMIYLFVTTYVFPLQARFYNPVKRTLFNSFFMSVRHLLYTIGIVVLDILLVLGWYFSMFYVQVIFTLMFLFGFPLIAFVNSYFFNGIFARYMPKEEQENEEDHLPGLLDDDNAEVAEAVKRLKGE